MHAPTLIAIIALNLICSGALLWLIARGAALRAGLFAWAAGLGLFGATFLGRLAFDLRAPPPASVVIDVSMVAALLLFERGLQQFFNASSRPARPQQPAGGRIGAALRSLPGLFVAVFAVVQSAIAFGAGTAARFSTLNVVIGGVYLLLAWRAGREGGRHAARHPMRAPLYGLATMMALMGVLSLLRGASIGLQGTEVMFAGWFAQLYFA